MAEWPVGQEVECPKCHRRGLASVDRFTAKGEEYWYRTVIHYEKVNGKRRVKRCTIARATAADVARVKALRGAAPAAAPAAKLEVGTEAGEAAKVEAPREEVLRPVAALALPPEPKLEKLAQLPPRLDNTAYYLVKVLGSYGAFKENPTPQNLSLLRERIEEVAERKGLEGAEEALAFVDHLAKVLEAVQVPGVPAFEAGRAVNRAKVAANEAMKRYAAQLVQRYALEFAAPLEAKARELEARVRELEEENAKLKAELEALRKVPTVKVSKEDYAVAWLAFRKKKSLPEEVRDRAYEVWDRVFAPGAKVVEVEG
jgi:regulator of replication initiation timing